MARVRGGLPQGLKAADHDKVRDAIIEKLLAWGHELHGAWEHWALRSTGASEAQIWGSERTYYRDMDFEWHLHYSGGLEAAVEQSEIFGSRYPVKDCALPGGDIKHLQHDSKGTYTSYHNVGMEIIPPSQEERGEEPQVRRPKNVRVIEYTCKKCGQVWSPARQWKTAMVHGSHSNQRSCMGNIELTRNELVKLP